MPGRRTKRCCICKANVPVEQFNRRKASRDGLQKHCRECNRKASQAYYVRNPTKHKREVKKHQLDHIARNREYLLEHLLAHPCIDCGERDPRVLEFDHVGGEKARGVGRMAVVPMSMRRIREEVAKCEVRCVNCHRRRTARTQSWWHNEETPGA